MLCPMACADISQRGPKGRRLQCPPTTTESAAPAKAARIGKAGGAAASEGRASYRRLSVPCAVATCRKTLGWQSALACRCGPCAKNVRSPHLATNRHVKAHSCSEQVSRRGLLGLVTQAWHGAPSRAPMRPRCSQQSFQRAHLVTGRNDTSKHSLLICWHTRQP